MPLKFQREGIRYDDLSEDEKDQWDALEWNEEGEIPDRVGAEAVNKWLFNKDTVDKVLAHLMTRGAKVAGGDRLGKTIIFAKNHDHAEFIAERFNKNYPHFRGEFARVIDFKVEYAQSLIDNFSNPDKAPHIAISVDMLDTGIDIPEVVNLVFFKLVRSKTKFWQMLGRGTRLRPDLFGPGNPKKFFYLFDYCQNLEFFSQNPEMTEGALGESLGKKLFTARLELIGEIDRKLAAAGGNPTGTEETRPVYCDPETETQVREEVAALLYEQVANMNVQNFIVRPRRRMVEKYNSPTAWKTLGEENFHELADHIAGLPTELVDEDEEAKRFDLLLLKLQLAVLRKEPAFTRLRDQVRAIAGLLEEKAAIPMVQEQMRLILEIQTDEYWQDVTTPMLEIVRKRLRVLVKLIEKSGRKPIYTDFEDQMGDETTFELPGFGTGMDFERFLAKTRQFLRQNENHLTIHKVRWNEPLTAADLGELEKMLIDAGVGTSDELDRAKRESNGLGLFIRSLVGLDREAAKRAFGNFLSGKATTANQIEFINLIIDHLTEHGVMEPELLYESPFTDINPQGPESIFSSAETNDIIRLLEEIRKRAAA